MAKDKSGNEAPLRIATPAVPVAPAGDGDIPEAIDNVLGAMDPVAEAAAEALAAANPVIPVDPVIENIQAEPVAEPVAAPVAEPVVSDSPVPDDVVGTPAAAPVVPHDDDDDLPDTIAGDQKANKAWAKVKTERREMRDKAKSLEAEIERLRTNQTPDLEEVVGLRKQIESYETKIGQLDITRTRDFKAKFDAPRDSVFNRGVSLLIKAGREADHAKSIMGKLVDPSLSFDQVQELVSEEPFALQGSMVTLAAEYQELEQGRTSAIENWQETRAALGEQAVDPPLLVLALL